MSDPRTAPRYAILEAPSILGLRPTGVDRLPETLLRHGLAEALDARCAARIEPDDPYDPRRGDTTKTLNAGGIARYSRKLAAAVESVLDGHEFPLVLGGDCSIVLGPMLALRRRGRYGLLFVDGHADFYEPEVNPNGEAASMDLAFATGRGPDLLADIDGRKPLVRDEDVFAFAFRDGDEQRQYGSQPLPPTLRALDLDAVRRLGIGAASREAIDHLARAELAGFWIHVDADCLDDAIMPAVDYRMEGGLSWEELATLLRVALDSGKAVGLEVTIYNPSLDETGEAGRGLARTLADALGCSRTPPAG